MRAHHAYLAAIRRNLFMSDIVFAPLIKQLLNECDMLAGGIERLRLRYNMADVQVETRGDETRDAKQLSERCRSVTRLLKQLMGRLHRIDEEREAWVEEESFGGRRDGAKVDRLLMRMDLGNLEA